MFEHMVVYSAVSFYLKNIVSINEGNWEYDCMLGDSNINPRAKLFRKFSDKKIFCRNILFIFSNLVVISSFILNEILSLNIKLNKTNLII